MCLQTEVQRGKGKSKGDRHWSSEYQSFSSIASGSNTRSHLMFMELSSLGSSSIVQEFKPVEKWAKLVQMGHQEGSLWWKQIPIIKEAPLKTFDVANSNPEGVSWRRIRRAHFPPESCSEALRIFSAAGSFYSTLFIHWKHLNFMGSHL